MMRIAMVYDAIYPFVKGGGEKRIYELGKRLVMKGHEVHLFGVKWWNGSDIIENEGLILHGVCGSMELYVDGRRSISEAIIFSIKLIPRLMEEKYDIIDVTAFPYFSCFSTKLVSFLKGTPMVITSHEVWGDYWYEYMGKSGFFGKTIEYLASRLGQKSTAVSIMTKNNLELLGIDSKNIHIIQNGVDLRRICIINPSENKCDVIFVGRLIKEKNVDVLIEAICHLRKDLPNVQCHIIGDGPEKEKLIGLIVKCGLPGKVRFFDFMEHDEVIARIKSSKMLILPSSREGFGMVVVEAFACGIPVITVRETRNAAVELISEETGLIVNLDAKELSNAIYTLINMKDENRKKMSRSAMDSAGAYDWDNIADKLMHFYNKAILNNKDIK
jgi:glycosyltransferase involved in cell wall biosynthesis